MLSLRRSDSDCGNPEKFFPKGLIKDEKSVIMSVYRNLWNINKRYKNRTERIKNSETHSGQGFSCGQALSRYKKGSFSTKKEEYMYNFYEPKLE